MRVGIHRLAIAVLSVSAAYSKRSENPSMTTRGREGRWKPPQQTSSDLDGRLKKKRFSRTVGVSERPTEHSARPPRHVEGARRDTRNLPSCQRKVGVDCCKGLSRLCRSNPVGILTWIVTGGETRVHYYYPVSKRESMEWREKGGEPPVKFEVAHSAGKVMSTIFWDSEGYLVIDYKENV